MRQKNSALAGKILRRCSICKRFHASFQVEGPGGTVSLCYACWKATQAPPPPEPEQGGDSTLPDKSARQLESQAANGDKETA